MSAGWTNGSTRRWRGIRAYVLDRDRWVCQLCHEPIERRHRHPHPRSAQVHHLDGKRHGDNPERCVAAHRQCNLDAGEPAPAPDPEPRPLTEW
ncbi:hypothetical protein [Amycolatopsis sp. NPDC051128]|uniref:HNH endonuclease n=1 Tax=Amycolatopsis sp. NPDC051128 TaxID=3155412 RepID=UPI003416662E